jgi:hypothetical protein
LSNLEKSSGNCWQMNSFRSFANMH